MKNQTRGLLLTIVALLLTISGTAAAHAYGSESNLQWVAVDYDVYDPDERVTDPTFKMLAGSKPKIILAGDNGVVDVDLLDKKGRKVFDLATGPVDTGKNKGRHIFKRAIPKNLHGTYKMRVTFNGDDGTTFTDTSRTAFIIKRLAPIPVKYKKSVRDISKNETLRLNPCEVTTIRFNDSRLPKSKRKAYLTDLKWAAKQMTFLTKSPYKVIGRTAKGKPAKITVQWKNLKGPAIGLAHLKKFEYVADQYWEIRRATVSIDKGNRWIKNKNIRRTTLVHELMHVAGRGHATQSSKNVMAPRVHGNETFKATAADRFAMNRLGRGGGCL